MAWTSKVAVSKQYRDTVEVLWVELSDGGELTADVLVDVSAFTKRDGSAASGCVVEFYEAQLFGAQDVGYYSLQVGSTLIDAGGAGQKISGPSYREGAARDDLLKATGDLTVTTLATDSGDCLRIKARVSLI